MRREDPGPGFQLWLCRFQTGPSCASRISPSVKWASQQAPTGGGQRGDWKGLAFGELQRAVLEAGPPGLSAVPTEGGGDAGTEGKKEVSAASPPSRAPGPLRPPSPRTPRAPSAWARSFVLSRARCWGRTPGRAGKPRRAGASGSERGRRRPSGSRAAAALGKTAQSAGSGLAAGGRGRGRAGAGGESAAPDAWGAAAAGFPQALPAGSEASWS